MNKTELSIKPNTLIENPNYLSSIENACLDIILNSINLDSEADKDKILYKIDLSLYAKYMNTKEVKHAYEEIRKGFDSLYHKDYKWGDIVLGGENRILAGLSWDTNNLNLNFVINPEAKRIIIEDKKNGYTLYPWKYSLSLGSKYSKRIYYCLKRWADKGIRIDENIILRETLTIPKSYNYGHFKKILLESIAEINEKTDLNVALIERKKNVRGGQKTVGFAWDIKYKKAEKNKNADELIEDEFKKRDKSLKSVPADLYIEPSDLSMTIPTEEEEKSIEEKKNKDNNKSKNVLNSYGELAKLILDKNGYKLTNKELISIQNKAEDNNLAIDEFKKRLYIEIPKLPDKRNIVGSLVFAMSDKYITSNNKTNKDRLWRGTERNYSKEDYDNITRIMLKSSGLID